MSLSPEQTLLGRLVIIRKMIEIGNFDACVLQISKLREDYARFSNVRLGNKIAKGIERLEKLSGQKKSKKAIMQDLDRLAKSLISIFADHGLT